MRPAIPKSLRFEVFKRDSFTCQYCGRKAPEVILHCDHVHPVSDNGPTDILNLVAACVDCNLGKGATPLSDQSALAKQQAQLDELQERREQIDMMIRWRDELQSLGDTTLSRIEERIAEKSGWTLSEKGRADLRRIVKKYDLSDVLPAADDAFDAYMVFENDSHACTSDSFNVAFRKISAFASLNYQSREKPYFKRLAYIQGIIRKRAWMRHYNCIAYLEHAHLCGLSLDDLESRAKGMRNRHLEDFEGAIDVWLQEIGKPY